MTIATAPTIATRSAPTTTAITVAFPRVSLLLPLLPELASAIPAPPLKAGADVDALSGRAEVAGWVTLDAPSLVSLAVLVFTVAPVRSFVARVEMAETVDEVEVEVDDAEVDDDDVSVVVGQSPSPGMQLGSSAAVGQRLPSAVGERVTSIVRSLPGSHEDVQLLSV